MMRVNRVFFVVLVFCNSVVRGMDASSSGQARADHYATLGVSHTATQSEIHKAYRALALHNHPDRSEFSEATKKMQEINCAYEVLGSETSRRAYDDERMLAHLPEVQPTYRPASRPAAQKIDPYADNIFFRLVNAIKDQNLAVVKAMIKSGVDVNVFDKKVDEHIRGYGSRALHYAVESRNSDLIIMLLNAGANPNAVDDEGTPPLVEYIGQNKVTPGLSDDIVALFIAKGVDVLLRGDSGKKALDLVDKKKYPTIYAMLRVAEEKK